MTVRGCRSSCTARQFVVSCALLIVAVGSVAAQSFHQRPLRLIVPFPPGGGLDLTARLLSPHLGDTLAKPIVVDNRGGAGGLIGLEIASRASADGHVFVMCSASHVIQAIAMKPAFDLFRDLVPVAEFQLVTETIRRFRTGYIAEFGAAAPDDQLYESVTEGRRYPGMEHWLSLFHDRLETLLDASAQDESNRRPAEVAVIT